MKSPTPAQIQNAETQALTTARDIVANLRKGVDFARLVEDYQSADAYLKRGGKWERPLKKGELVDTKLETMIFALPANTIGDPYLDHRTDFNDSKVIIIKTGTRQEAETIPFVKAQGQIVGELHSRAMNLAAQKKLEQLRGGASVEAVNRNLELVVSAAVARYATK